MQLSPDSDTVMSIDVQLFANDDLDGIISYRREGLLIPIQ